ncbi:hypothetical protein SEUCBS140593_008464 [Sporothrix eucalyptigena]|uniref:Uncharacterized protein n=1 Tax=Sporothrix eucalyptigena TaxID=1812306 RepID=A0ABP0CLN9_9PEZI
MDCPSRPCGGYAAVLVSKFILLKAKVAVGDVFEFPAQLKENPNVLLTNVDVSSRATVHNWVEEIVAKFGRLDCMAANAGISNDEGDVASDNL